MYDPEAVIQDADIEQFEMEQIGRSIAQARKAGHCTHQSVVGYRQPIFYPEQEGLKPGQMRCTEGCGRVFEDDDDWYYARHEFH